MRAINAVKEDGYLTHAWMGRMKHKWYNTYIKIWGEQQR